MNAIEPLTEHGISVPLEKSVFLQTIPYEGRFVIWHSLFGNALVVDEGLITLIDLFNDPRSISSLAEEYELDDQSRELINGLIETKFLVPENFDERGYLAEQMSQRAETIQTGSRLQYLELIMSEACNLRCTYCIHFTNLETSSRIDNPQKFMTWEMAKMTVDGYFEKLRIAGKKEAVINFGGGEPLLIWDVIEQVLHYCRDQYGDKMQVRFTINTNATLITENIAKALKEFNVDLAVSLDGLKEGNDQVRITKSGKGSFDRIMVGLDNLSKIGYPIDGIAVTVDGGNYPFLDEALIDWAVERQLTEVRIDIDVVNLVTIPLNEIVQKLMSLRAYARDRGIAIAGFWSRAFENLNESTLTEDVAFCGAVRGNNMCVSPSGSIYGCGYSNTQLGEVESLDVFNLAGQPYDKFVRGHQTGTMEMCKGCMIEGQCAGGCNITFEFANATGSNKLDRMCDFYRRMTTELIQERFSLQEI